MKTILYKSLQTLLCSHCSHSKYGLQFLVFYLAIQRLPVNIVYRDLIEIFPIVEGQFMLSKQELSRNFSVPFFRLNMQYFQIMSDFSHIARQRKCPCFCMFSPESLIFKIYFFTNGFFPFFYSIDVWKLGHPIGNFRGSIFIAELR